MVMTLSAIRSFCQKSQIGLKAFRAKSHDENNQCDSNGLPLTLNSITIFGRSQILKTFNHENLCKFIDIARPQPVPDCLVIISQLWGESLAKQFEKNDQDKLVLTFDNIILIAYQTLKALQFLHERDICHGNINLENIHIGLDFQGKILIKLYDYGFNHITAGGKYAVFVISHPKYLPPSTLDSSTINSIRNLNSNDDIWSLGIVLVELCLKSSLWSSYELSDFLEITSKFNENESFFEMIKKETTICENTPQILLNLIENCLLISNKDRLSASQLLDLSIFEKCKLDSVKPKYKNRLYDEQKIRDLCEPFDINMLYYWWQLCDGKINDELKNSGINLEDTSVVFDETLTNSTNLVILENKIFEYKNCYGEFNIPYNLVKLNFDSVFEKFEPIPMQSFYPLIHCKVDIIKRYDSLNASSEEEMESSLEDMSFFGVNNTPIFKRELDAEYQFHRAILFNRMLKGYPFTRDLIVEEAKKDVCPLFRGDIWAAILDVKGNFEEIYERIDKESPSATDRQIAVDIPRCHQYNDLLSSNEGHAKLKRLLKAWIVSHPQYVYWQGLDSLTAPFLFLNFNNEAKAYACLSAFIPKYLYKFFLKDNSPIIQEYLAKFLQIIAFHDPILANHLISINFVPELFAIPWFLTMFSHLFPIHKILNLWDKLLLSDSSFPFYIGLSVLRQLRDILLASDFNDCILLFSHLPAVDIETCVAESVEKYHLSPKSITARKYQNGGWNENNDLEISNVELKDLQNELSPRISASDLLNLLIIDSDTIIVVDIRSNAQYNRASLDKSINIPFSKEECELDSVDTECLGIYKNLLMNNKYYIVIIVASEHKYANNFAKILVKFGVHRVCILHGGINVLYAVTPTVLTSKNNKY